MACAALSRSWILNRSWREVSVTRMNFDLTSGPPNYEIRCVGARMAVCVSPSKAFRLTSIFLHCRIAVEQKCELPFLEGFTLDRLVSFTCDSVAQIVGYGHHTPDVTCRGFTFKGHMCLFSFQQSLCRTATHDNRWCLRDETMLDALYTKDPWKEGGA